MLDTISTSHKTIKNIRVLVVHTSPNVTPFPSLWMDRQLCNYLFDLITTQNAESVNSCSQDCALGTCWEQSGSESLLVSERMWQQEKWVREREREERERERKREGGRESACQKGVEWSAVGLWPSLTGQAIQSEISSPSMLAYISSPWSLTSPQKQLHMVIKTTPTSYISSIGYSAHWFLWILSHRFVFPFGHIHGLLNKTCWFWKTWTLSTMVSEWRLR